MYVRFDKQTTRMSTTKQTMYARYVELTLPLPVITGHAFLMLPYHERLRLAGLKIKLHKELSCSALRHHPIGVAIDLPKLDKDHFSEYRKGDVYLLGQDKQSYIVYPFEYDIVW